MKKIGSLIAIICVVNAFMLAGLLGYLYGTGRLDQEKSRAILDILRHQGEPPKFRASVYDILQPTTAPAATQTAATQSGPDASTAPAALAGSAQDRLDDERRAVEAERLQLANQAQDLRHRQELLDHLQADVQAKLDKIDADKKSFEQQVAQEHSSTRDAAFQKTLDLYNALKPTQVKDLFVGMSPALVAQYIEAMDPQRAGKIMGEFQTTQEQTFLARVIEQVRTSGTKSASGATPGAGNLAAASGMTTSAP